MNMNKYYQELEYEVKNGSVRILGCCRHRSSMEIPSEIEGLKVTEIADYAFSEQIERVGKLNFTTSSMNLEEIILPATLKKIGRYAFYNCYDLKRIKFYNTLKDIGAGAFTGCHRIKEIDITFLGEQKSCLREILTDIPEEQTLFYHSDLGEAKLIFPEFFEEAVENTPARILETHTHGSGMMYRNCFVHQELQFHLYDDRFEWAKGREYEDTLFRLVFARLLFPFQLTEKAKERYINFLQEKFESCASWVAKGMYKEECYFLAEHCVKTVKEIELLIQEISKTGETEMISYLMDFQHKNFKRKRKMFEL